MNNCYVCGATGAIFSTPVMDFRHSVTSESKLLPARSTLAVCGRCGHVNTHTGVDFAHYYAAQYDATLSDDGHDEIVTLADRSVVFRTDLDYALLRRYLAPHMGPGAAILEYGFGRGRMLARLCRDDYQNLHGYELSELYRPAAEKLLGPARVSIGDRPTGTFDAAYSLFVLEHDTDPVESLLYLRAALRTGGALYLVVPNYLTNAVDLACADHVNHFTPASIASLLGQCGFSVRMVDDTSNTGATLVIALSDGRRVDRTALRTPALADPGSALASTAPFTAMMDGITALSGRIDAGRKVYLYGAGFYAALVSAHLAPTGVDVAGLFDANPRKQGTTRLGQRVSSPHDITRDRHREADLVVCVNPAISHRIALELGGAFHQTHTL